MVIYLIRHGKDDEGYRGGWSQRGLNVEGFRQSERLGRYLYEHRDRIPVDEIISSDLQRALDTANEIGRALGKQVIPSGAWRETNNGVIAGMPNEIVDERYPKLYFAGLRMDERYPGGESPIEFFTRIRNAIEELCAKKEQEAEEKHTMVVTHGGVINAIYHVLKGKTWTNQAKAYPSSYTGFHKIERRNGEWMITVENDTEHLAAK